MFIIMVSDSTLQLTIKYYHLSNFDVVSKNSYNYLKKQLKYSFLSQLSICVKPEFLHILQPK